MKKRIICGIAAAVVLCGSIGLLTGCGKKADECVIAEEITGALLTENDQIMETQEDAAVGGSEFRDSGGVWQGNEEPEGKLYVYVCGEVQNPGVYVLSPEARVCDAIEACGGMLEDAAADYWNLAQAVHDGQMIYVPSVEELEQMGIRTHVSLLEPEEQNIAEQTAERADYDGRININTATKEQLMTISGIGESKAEKIIAYREENGDFCRIEDIMEISGIKQRLFEQIKEYIRVN